MIAFVGSQLVKVGSDEELGFKHRVDAQRLWAISVGLEHAIMLLRVFILKVEPEEPDWVQDSKDILCVLLLSYRRSHSVLLLSLL